MDPKNTYPGDYVRVTTLNAGAGLESPIVFLVGLRELFEEEHSIRLSDDEREEIILDNTRKSTWLRLGQGKGWFLRMLEICQKSCLKSFHNKSKMIT